MRNKFRWVGVLAALGALSLAAGTASASVLNYNFTFNSFGSVADVSADCGPGCLKVTTQGTAFESGGDLPGTTSWEFSGTMKFYQGADSGVGFGVGPGLGWSFTDNTGSNDLSGSFFTVLSGELSDLERTGSVFYTIEDGTGLFSGAYGIGFSQITVLLGVLLFEEGSMSVFTPVPEPGVTGLLLAGLGMLGFVTWRRRRAQAQL